MHTRRILVSSFLSIALAACSTSDVSSCGAGEVVRSSRRDACVYEAAVVIESGFTCPTFAPHLVALGDLAACVDHAPETSAEHTELCALVGARCDASPDEERETTVGARCALDHVPAGGFDPSEIYLESFHDECVSDPGVTTGCIDDGRDGAPPFCTCRCDAPEGSDVPTCACPAGTTCESVGFLGELAGGYCVRP